MTAARGAVKRLLDLLATAVYEIDQRRGRAWEAAEVALRWIDHEIAPLLKELKGEVRPGCPVCAEGELEKYTDTEGAVYSCGHRMVLRTAPMSLLPMSSGVPILPGQSAQITSRPQRHPFRPTRLVILGRPERWLVQDITIGNVSQTMQAGGLPGSLFAREAPMTAIRFDVVQTATDVVLIVTYIGPEEHGESFSAALYGEVSDGYYAQALIGTYRQIVGAPAISEQRVSETDASLDEDVADVARDTSW